MAALDFPATPTDGEVYGNYVWSASKGAWQASPTPQSVAVSSPTAPSNPKVDTLWYNTQDGNTYIYFYDGNTSQWVQLKSDATLSSTLGNRVETLEAYPSGFVKVIPTSVTLSGGSATVSSSGRVTVTGSTSYISLNGILKSGYDSYRVIFNLSSTNAATEVRARLRSVATDDSSANYMYNFQNAAGSTYGAIFSTTDTSFQVGRSNGTTGARIIMDFLSPNLAQWTNITAMSADGVFASITSGALKTTTAYDGISFIQNQTINSAVIDVYGYRN